MNAELVTQVHELCRNRWRYQLPTDEGDRHTLRELCDLALGFQNHFLGRYRDYLLNELSSTDTGRQLLAVQRLGEVVFPDPTMTAALTKLLTAGSPTLRDTVRAVLDRYRTLQS